MRWAESFVEGIFDWERIILDYSLLQKKEDVQRCLALAEKMAKSVEDWNLLAGMAYVHNDDALFEKCMKTAESLARTGYDWENCAGNWETYPQSKNDVDRCRQMANEVKA